MASPNRILFGGTFDPPHLGHQDMLTAACAQFPDAIIHIIPSQTPPSKDGETKEVATSFRDRVAMCKLAFSQQIDEEVTSDPAKVSYTIDMLNTYQNRYPNDRLAVLIGQDQLENFSNWRSPKLILAIADLVVAPRSSQSSLTQAVTDLGVKLQLSINEDDNHRWLAKQNSAQSFIYSLAMPLHSARSTNIRQGLSANDVHPNVYQYIKKNNLYSPET